MNCKWCGKEFTEKSKIDGVCPDCAKDCNKVSLTINNFALGFLIIAVIGSMIMSVFGLINEEITLIISGISIFFSSILLYYFFSGIAEIIRLLDKISKK